jgi:flagella basal body P-ring formation protein FlgA
MKTRDVKPAPECASRSPAVAAILLLLAVLPRPGVAEPMPPGGRPQSIESIRSAAVGSVREQLGGTASQAVITAGELDRRLRLGACGKPLEALPPPDGVARAEVVVKVSCRGVGWSVYVPVHVEVDLPVLVLQKPVGAGVRIAASDVVAETRRVAGVFSEFVPDAAALAGHHSKRPLPAGTVLVADMLTADPLVTRGQQVMLVAALGSLEVRAPGRVLSDAAVATRVRVENLSSRRIVEGVVESADVVRITP